MDSTEHRNAKSGNTNQSQKVLPGLAAKVALKDVRKTRGAQGEAFAATWLEARGYQIIARNWRPGAGAGRVLRGELDLVAWLPLAETAEREARKSTPQNGILCFIEVKSRSQAAAAPQEAVHAAKQRQISRLAEAFVALELAAVLAQLGVSRPADEVPCRFDVVEVWLQNEEPHRIALHANAFDFRGAQ